MAFSADPDAQALPTYVSVPLHGFRVGSPSVHYCKIFSARFEPKIEPNIFLDTSMVLDIHTTVVVARCAIVTRQVAERAASKCVEWLGGVGVSPIRDRNISDAFFKHLVHSAAVSRRVEEELILMEPLHRLVSVFFVFQRKRRPVKSAHIQTVLFLAGSSIRSL